MVGTALGAILLASQVYKFMEETMEVEAQRSHQREQSAPVQSGLASIKHARPTAIKNQGAQTVGLSERVKRFFAREVTRIGQTIDRPEMAAARLYKFADLLTDDERAGLRAHALSETVEADARFLSIYLLANSGKPSSIHELLSIASSPVPRTQNSTEYSFELAIRAQAIEGFSKQGDKMAAIAAAREVVNLSNETFLVDRAQRVLYELGGSKFGKFSGKFSNGKSLESQDREALEALLQR